MPEWTKDQLKAIDHRNHNILVSAAAGSGKTTILIERILKELKGNGPNGRENIDNLLVATFTEAAAAEMKDRLLSKLKDAVNEENDPELKKHLQKQIFKIPMANISTLHAFCLSVIKKFYYVIDLDPNFRLLSDETEKSILQEQAYDDIRNDFYDYPDGGFLQLTDNFSDDRSDDGLKDVVFKLYDFAITNANTNEWLDSLVKPYQFNDSFTESTFYKNKFLPQIKQQISEMLQSIDKAIDLASMDLGASVFLDQLQEVKQVWSEFEQSLAVNSYDKIREFIGDFKIKSRKAKLSKDEDPDKTIANQVEKLRDNFKSQCKSLYNSYFVKSESEVNEALIEAQTLISELVKVERKFMEHFNELKLNRHVVDFNDLEHLTVAILQGDVDGRKIAQEYYQNKFHELMIDEYQDTNAMQESIVNLLHSDNNYLFMVGDIKQSIYGFRQAKPSLFTEKYERYQNPDNDDELIKLSKNFRSSEEVDNFVNQIFTRIFDKKIGDIDYDAESQLVTGTDFPDNVDKQNELTIFVPESVNDDSNLDDDESITKRQTLINAAAQRIQELIASGFKIYDSKIKDPQKQIRRLKYSDIAIISRTKENNTDIISNFSKVNIPVMVTDAQNYFQTTELQIMMSMLNIVDNPYQDIPLVAVLRSPIIRLNEEQLAQIRLIDKHNSYYTALQKYIVSENKDKELQKQLKAFLAQLETYRDFANKNSIARLIWKIYQETGLLEYVSGMPGGKQRAANLHALYQRADAYEENNFKGFHQFIGFIKHMQDLDKDLSQPNSIEANDDTVRVMTVHASKGLEFPIIIYLDMAKHFNMQDVISQTVFDDNGIGITVKNNETRLQYKTIQRGIISQKKKIATFSEEMRLLYVALTRAKQKLIMFGYAKSQDDLLKLWRDVPQEGLIDETTRLKANTFQDLVGISTMSGIDQDGDFTKNRVAYNKDCQLRFEILPAEAVNIDTNKKSINARNNESVNNLFKESVNDILDMEYRYQESVNTTAYQSVSEIKGLFADPDDEQMAEDLLEDTSRYNLGSFPKPQFLTKTNKITNAEIGSVTHLVLQKIAIDKTPEENNFKELIEQMVNEKLLTPELAEKIDLEGLTKLYQSNLGQIIVNNHENVSREYTCSVLMPAEKLFKKVTKDYSVNDKILVHGIIDGVIELEHGIIIFDYKTDHVTAENKAELISKYSGQVNLYAEAISAIKNKPVVGKYLYFLKINEAIDLQEK